MARIDEYVGTVPDEIGCPSCDEKGGSPYGIATFTSMLAPVPEKTASASTTDGDTSPMNKPEVSIVRRLRFPFRTPGTIPDEKPSRIMREFRRAMSPLKLELRGWFKREASPCLNSDCPNTLSHASVLVLQTPETSGSIAGDADDTGTDQPIIDWYCDLKWTVFGEKGPVFVDTQTDTGCKYCLMNYDLAKRLKLEIHPLLNGGFNLKGFGGRQERLVKFTYVELECPTIGQERVQAQVMLVRAKEVPGLLVGGDFVARHAIDGKISDARREMGADIPQEVLSTSNGNNISLTIFDERPSRKLLSQAGDSNKQSTNDRIDVKARDAKIYQQGQPQRIHGIESVQRGKGFTASASSRSIASSGKSVWASEPSLPPSTVVSSRTSTFASVFSVGESVASAATSVASTPLHKDMTKTKRGPMGNSAAVK